ncbi:Riboflavin transporter MCH5 [Grifola frondosa]|uniref:Riboflavin transporter MCH5 n=1 Tax=Grifola frondosa TaxID=5627 RepID=A0A1C7LNE0_GRIFR|nr:Riboflavin transporter MCH5 [Grifola frondosa]
MAAFIAALTSLRAQRASSSTIHNDSPREIEANEDHRGKSKEEDKEVDNAVAPVEPFILPADQFPDGGLRAWLVVLGAACGTCGTFGFVNAWGVFQAYYTDSILSDTAPSTIAWIGSVQYALVFIPGLVFGRLFDMGHFKLPLFFASCLLVAATFLVAQCTEFWQLILCQGIALGFACGAIFGPVMGTVPHWFKKRLGIALGIMAFGSSIGGTVFPIAIRNLIQDVGFPWTMRIIGFIEIALLGVCNLTVERRLPPKMHSGAFIKLPFLGLYTVLTYIDVSAAAAGVPENFSFYLLSIANAASAVGRLSGGVIADRTGPLNVMIPGTFIAGIITYAWPYATTQGSNIAVAILYGMSSGVYVSLLRRRSSAWARRTMLGCVMRREASKRLESMQALP